MPEKSLTPRGRVEVRPDTKWMSLLFGEGAPLRKDLEEGEEEKVDLFELGLAKELKAEDTINEAFTKIVRMALAAEFGASFAKAKGAKGMIDTIVSGIMGDGELRKQALMIVNRYAK